MDSAIELTVLQLLVAGLLVARSATLFSEEDCACGPVLARRAVEVVWVGFDAWCCSDRPNRQAWTLSRDHRSRKQAKKRRRQFVCSDGFRHVRWKAWNCERTSAQVNATCCAGKKKRERRKACGASICTLKNDAGQCRSEESGWQAGGELWWLSLSAGARFQADEMPGLACAVSNQ